MVKRWGVIFDIDEENIVVLSIGHKKVSINNLNGNEGDGKKGEKPIFE